MVSFCIVLVLGVAVLAAQAGMLRLGGTQFDPLAGQSSPTGKIATSAAPQTQTAGTLDSNSASAVNDDYVIVQFDGPVLPQWRESLIQAGATVLDYVPDFAFIVRLAQDKQDMVRALAHVRWVGPYAADYRISQEAKALAVFSPASQQGGAAATSDRVKLRISAFPGENAATLTAWIMTLGGSVEDVHESEWGIRLVASLAADKIDDVAAIPGVKWVEIRREHRTSNDKALRIVGAGGSRIGASTDLLGTGQVVAVCDSGLDKGSATDVHPDFLDGSGGSRVLNIFRWGSFSSSRDLSGHGTHVAGSVLGNGKQSGASPAGNVFPQSSFAGMAPKASLVFQAVGNPDVETSELPGFPSDLNRLFQQALDATAQIHTNSWGTGGTGKYDGESANVDQFTWANKGFLILFAAGNAGADRNRDGVIDTYSLDTPGTAKNCLTVGASESLRAKGGYSEDTWGGFVPSTGPLPLDLLSNNTVGMAAFSSRGPCADGRTKPDIVAPGTNILSTRSSKQLGNGWGPYNDWYYYSGGTSMATPVTAGTAALLREYLTTKVAAFAGTPPSAAMLKACLVNGATRMEPGQYGSGQYKEIATTPGPVAGWGRVNLAGAVYPKSPYFIARYDNAAGLTTNGQASYKVSNLTDDDQLRVTLAWTDYPSTESANGGLVNDLDLMVTDASGKVHYPDNAKTQTAMSQVSYYDKAKELGEINVAKVALRLTPDAYPRRLASLHWGGKNEIPSRGSVVVAVYAADGSGQPAGEPLFSETLQSWPDGECALPVDIDVAGGDVVAVFTFSNPTGMGLLGSEGNASGRAMVNDGSGWQAAPATPAVVGIFFAANPSESFDRVNNLVGVTIDKPSGEYTVTVKGYNVPYGPQPFALVISGTNGEVVENRFETVPNQPNAPTYGSVTQSFVTMDAAQIKDTYKLSLSSVYGQVGEYNATISGGSGLVAMRRAMTFDSDKAVSSLGLYKLYGNGTDARPFTYSDLGEFQDGMWWLSEADGTRIASGSNVEAGKVYYVNSVVLDNGLYDMSSITDSVHEPQILGNSQAAPTPDSGGGGGGGCTAGQSSGAVPLVLLLTAAVVLLLRRRAE